MATKQKQKKKKDDGVVHPGLRFDEKLVGPFEADILATAEYERVYRRRFLSPEHELMVAILEGGIADFRKCVVTCEGKDKKSFAEAEAWILDENTDWIFSFVNICEVLRFDPDYLRQGLQHWKQERLEKKSSPVIGPKRKTQKGRIPSAA